MRRAVWWVLGLVLLIGGITVALVNRTSADDVGWFAYTPLSTPASTGADWSMSWPDSTTTTAWVLTPWQLVGLAVAVLGLVVLAAAVGFRLGRRRTTAG